MGISKIIAVLTLFLCVTTVSGQSILQDYFKGNKDSLIVEATRLINQPEPTFKNSQPTNIDPEIIKEMGFEQVYKANDYYFTLRDNRKIFAYQFPKKTENTIILIHGVASTAYLYNKTAGLLQEATQAEVFAIDLRGHGKSDGKSGDVNYINQYAHDLSDIIKTIRKQKPKGKIIVAGHSMGGGVALNYAMLSNKTRVDGYILFAPLLGHNSPTLSTPTGKASQEEPFMNLHIMRIIGLKMFNDIGDHSKDSLPVMFLNLPESSTLRAYTYRANQSMAPNDYKTGLKSINVPALVLIGSKDEAFNAPALEKAVLENSKANVIVVEAASHNGIRHHPKSYQSITDWFSKNNFR